MGNLVQSGKFGGSIGISFQSFMAELKGPPCNIGAGIDSFAKLTAAEESMDAMAAEENCGLFYQYLELQVEKYLRANPSLLQVPWVRKGGAVYDLIEKMRVAA